MKKLPLLLTTALIGLSSNLFSQTGTTSYEDNNENLLGSFSTYIGGESGNFSIATAYHNTFIGYRSGFSNTTGGYNTFIGGNSGRENTTGRYNIFTGRSSGYNNKTGSNNIFIGDLAGYNNENGSGNVFLGNRAGFSETSSDKLYVDNTNTSSPLIYGDFAEDQLTFNGQVQVGSDIDTPFPTTVGGVNISDYTLFVKGGLLSDEVRVSTDWADYVFNDTYKLKSLNEVENFINKNGHLPNVPSAKEVETSGIEMGEITKIQQEKIEELTLYLIAMDKKDQLTDERFELMDKRVKLLEEENTRLRKELISLSK